MNVARRKWRAGGGCREILQHFFPVIPAKAGLRRQDAGANTDEVDGPEGEPQDAASNPVTLIEAQRRWVPDHRFAVSGMTSKEMPRFRKKASTFQITASRCPE